MWYKGNKQRCEDYNAIVSFNQDYKGSTARWANIEEINDAFYILKHPDFDGTYLTLVNELPPTPIEIK